MLRLRRCHVHAGVRPSYFFRMSVYISAEMLRDCATPFTGAKKKNEGLTPIGAR
jgi:hypothetical protein